MSTAWLQDLSSRAPTGPIACDVCILGAGPVGLTLALELGEKGHRVTVLEIGGASASLPSPSFDACFDRRVYRGAALGRAIGLGGTSSLWGGQLLPVRPNDIVARTTINAPAWPIAIAEIAPYFLKLQRKLGIDVGSFELASLRSRSHALTRLTFADWAPRISKWLSFGQRNIASLWADEFKRCPGVQVWLNAKTESWQFAGTIGKRVACEIIAHSTNGHALRVQPKRIVIAAGAIESARIVFDVNETAGSLSTGVKELTGRFLHDHLSVRIAQVQMIDAARFQDLFAPIFEGSIMRSLRMELSPETLNAEGLPGLYAHFVAETAAQSGFAVIRDCLRAAQRRNARDALSSAMRIPGAVPDILKLAYGRFVKKRLEFPSGCQLYLHVDIEQAPRRENRVYLGNPEADGRRTLHIDWELDADTPRIARRVQLHFRRFWKSNGLQGVAALNFVDLGDDAGGWARNVHDIYHPAGTTRMSVDPTEGVVDANLMIHGLGNVFVVGSSVFPSMGAANPTFTAMALALRLADFIDRESHSA